MKKVIILGAHGMLGHVVYKYLDEFTNYALFSTTHSTKLTANCYTIDVLKTDQLLNLLDTLQPDIVINCIGKLIRDSSNDHATAIYINSYIPHLLSKSIKRWDGKLIHISTDCVFSGKKGDYTETDLSDANDMYGKSKYLGEVDNSSDLTIRTSIIGPDLNSDGDGLFNWFMKQNSEVIGYDKTFWSGITTLELAKAIHAAIEQNLTGLINISSKNKISKFELLQKIKSVFFYPSIDIKSNSDKKVDKSLTSSRTDFTFEVKEYSEMIADLYTFMKKNHQLYPKYDFLQ
jgi:dTDP-4-dehydrorhamnose reductase